MEYLKLVISNIPALILGCIGGYLCYLGKDGWGWFLFVSLLFGVGPDIISNSSNNNSQNR